MKNKIIALLTNRPSYFKWGSARIAQKFNCSTRTVDIVKNQLASVREVYLGSLKK